MEIRIPKQYNAACNIPFGDTMDIKAIYPEIQLDHFWFKTIFQEGGNMEEPNLLTVVASTIINGKPEFQWLHFEKGLMPINIDIIKARLREDFIFLLLNHEP